MTGFNINDKDAPFTEMILSGQKTIETRRSNSLDPAVGRRMAIVRTGVGPAQVVGTVIVGEPVWYGSRKQWDADRDLHQVPKGSSHDWQPPGKWGYPMIDPMPVSPRSPKGRGIVFRKVNPLDPRSAKTQIATTVSTYRMAAPQLSGRVLDYGAGLGLGSDTMRDAGLEVDSLEPFPERWLGSIPPRYRNSSSIPDNSYNGIVSFSVLNVVDPEIRDGIIRDIGRLLRPGGKALVTARTNSDVSKAKGAVPIPDDPGAYLIGKGSDARYQKGFSQSELESYARRLLGSGFTVQANRRLNGASILITKTGMKQNPKGKTVKAGEWVSILDLPEDIYRRAHSIAISRAGEGDAPRNFPKQLDPTYDEVFEIDSREQGLSIIYSMDPSGDLAVEYVRVNANRENPVLPSDLGRIIEPGDSVLNYDTAQGEDFYDLYDLIYTRRRPTTGEIEEVAGMLNDNGVFAVLSGESRDLGKYFQKVGTLGSIVVAQGPSNPEVSRINAEKRRRK